MGAPCIGADALDVTKTAATQNTQLIELFRGKAVPQMSVRIMICLVWDRLLYWTLSQALCWMIYLRNCCSMTMSESVLMLALDCRTNGGISAYTISTIAFIKNGTRSIQSLIVMKMNGECLNMRAVKLANRTR